MATDSDSVLRADMRVRKRRSRERLKSGDKSEGGGFVSGAWLSKGIQCVLKAGEAFG